MMMRFSLLELLHPDGRTNTSSVLGSHCPENLFPESQIEAVQKAALLIFAPSIEECRSKGWLEGAAKLVQHRLSDDGVCYVLVPPLWRLKVIRLLSRAGLVVGSSFWHFPDLASSQYMVPLQHGPARYAVENIITAPRWKRILAKEVLRYSSARKFLSIFWTSAGISVRRPGARPLFQWLFKQEHEEFSSGTAIIGRSWRGFRGANILHCFTQGDVLPSVIVKTVSVENASACLDREAEVLEALGPGIQSTGVQAPQILGKWRNARGNALFLSPIRGRPAYDLLASSPNLLFPLLTKVVRWLERWHVASVNVRALAAEQLEQDVFAPIERLAPFLPNARGYREWLADRLGAVVGTSLPFVATHNDLTMANVLIDEHNHLGVIDWETGMVESWPLVDFYYAVTDAARIAQGYTDWLEALKACYQPNGLYTQAVKCWEEQLRSAIGISPDLAELCFHACWLHHASNEHLVSHPGDPRPFLQIVQWLALSCAKSNEN